MRVAFAGVAHWHFSVDAQLPGAGQASGVEIVGLSDDDEALAKRRGEELGCGWTTDVDDLVTRFKPDLVIALPRPDRAPEQVGRLLDRKVPLFAEKPLGLCAADVWPLVERAEQGWVTVAFPQRYLPFWAGVRAAARLGRARRDRARRHPPDQRPALALPLATTCPGCSIRPSPGAGRCGTSGSTATDMLTQLVGDRG